MISYWTQLATVVIFASILGLEILEILYFHIKLHYIMSLKSTSKAWMAINLSQLNHVYKRKARQALKMWFVDFKKKMTTTPNLY